MGIVLLLFGWVLLQSACGSQPPQEEALNEAGQSMKFNF